MTGLDPRDRLGQAREVIELATQLDDPELELNARLWRLTALFELAEDEATDAELDKVRRLADAWRHPVATWALSVHLAMRALLAGDYTVAARLAADAWTAGASVVPLAGTVHRAQALAIALDLGDREALERALPDLQAAADDERVDRPGRLATLALVHAELGETDAAGRALERAMVRDLEDLRPDADWLLTTCALAEVCGRIEACDVARRLRALLAPHVHHNVLGVHGGVSWGSAARSAAIVARLVEDYDAAETLLAMALERHRHLGADPWLARTQVDLADVLAARGAPGDLDRAGALLAKAEGLARTRGLTALALRAGALRATLGAPGSVRDRAPEPPVVAEGGGSTATTFRQEGEFWTIAYEGQVLRLRNTRGLGYLAQLLWHPGRELHVTQLVREPGETGTASAADPDVSVARDLGDAGDVLDPAARAAYRRRLDDLREELAEAETMNDLGRLERARLEMEQLGEQLAGAARGRRVASHSERARLTVTKGIGAALDRIAKHNPALGRHLAATVRRGYFCVYVPDPRRIIVWER